MYFSMTPNLVVLHCNKSVSQSDDGREHAAEEKLEFPSLNFIVELAVRFWKIELALAFRAWPGWTVITYLDAVNMSQELGGDEDSNEEVHIC